MLKVGERKKKKIVTGTVGVGVLVILTYITLNILVESKPPPPSESEPFDYVLSPVDSLELKNMKVQQSQNIEIKGEMLPRIRPFECVRRSLRDNQTTFIMCIKPLETDFTISGDIYYEGYYEKDELRMTLNLLAKYPDATFLDIGSNIGMFSVTVAAANYSVIAVDPFKTNLAYTRLSTMLQGTENNVRYIPHTISDSKHTLYPWTPIKTNEGGTPFLTEEVAKTKPKDEIGEGVDSITFLELLDVVFTDTVIIKMDIEGSECNALVPFLENNPKTKIIPYILMEWVVSSWNVTGLCKDIQRLIQGFTANGYFPVNATSGKELELNTEKQWYNVLWVHQNAERFSLNL
ncbi:uncharacterized protein LOC111712635 [Eurytemora carolleeae]|uniref:uncharacterized protein LOC111712635 n=1 Tax=Eurytemora carolleeae TaxID=1294199 RepID=UPI000C778BDA|nr:uncharacterized protein LOC111712635 [Eurytemora carolleeae]|eukprot:XP_023343081.1 uncharacterized protein LOC111712635 [Eurytemora affinis]